MQIRLRDVYVTENIHDSRLVDRNNFSRDVLNKKKKKEFSRTTAYYRKSLKYTAKGNIGTDSGSETRPGYKSIHSMSRRRKERDGKKNKKKTLAVGFLYICQKFRIRVELRGNRARQRTLRCA